MTRGCFITLEGGEGAGKTTHVQAILGYLKKLGIEAIATREPGGTQISESIRGVLLDPGLPDMHPDTELLLMFAARNEHLQQVIIPALKAGQWVVCDRFTDATYAYQGYGRGLPLNRIADLETWVQGDLRPDFTLLFDIDVGKSLQRVKKRSDTKLEQIDRFEREQVEFHEKIRRGYLNRANKDNKRFRVINAEGSIDQVSNEVFDYLDGIYKSRALP